MAIARAAVALGTGASGYYALRMIECGMCGHEFTREEGSACQAGCPISKGCGLVTCPSCGYEFPPTSRVVELITSLVRGKRPAGAR